MAIHQQKLLKRKSACTLCNEKKEDCLFIFTLLCALLICIPACSPQTDTTVHSAANNPDVPHSQENLPPAITTEPVTRALPGTLYIYQAGADDPDGDELSWQLLESPTGVVLDRHSGLLYGEITSPGRHLIRLVVMDEQGADVEQSFNVVVEANPVITSIPPRYAFAGSLFRYQLQAYDPEQLGLSYTMTEGTAAMEFSRDSGLLTWVTPEPGVFDIELNVTNTIGNSATQTFQVEILHEEGLAIVSTPALEAIVSEQYEYEIAILGLQETGLRYTLVQGPQGMNLDEFTGRIIWGPVTEGMHHVEVLVSNEAGHQDDQAFEIEVTSLENMDLMFNSQIDTLFDNVSSGNFQEVATLLTPEARINLIPVLVTLQPFITTMNENLEPAQRMMISGDIAEYILSATQDGEHKSFIVTFSRNASGDWKIHSM